LDFLTQQDKDVLRVAESMRDTQNGLCFLHYKGQKETVWQKEVSSQVLLSTAYCIEKIDRSNRQLTVRCSGEDRNYERVILPFDRVTSINQIIFP